VKVEETFLPFLGAWHSTHLRSKDKRILIIAGSDKMFTLDLFIGVEKWGIGE
jgi:hypothetical protein